MYVSMRGYPLVMFDQAYSGRDVHANMNKQIGMQIAPTCPGTSLASGWTLDSCLDMRGW
jgi:hypothetical protein